MSRQKVYIREDSWLAKLAARRLKTSRMAIVVGHTIYLYNVSCTEFCSSPSWVLHELKHVEQYERLGLPGFIAAYLLESRKKGYFSNRFEEEARIAESEVALFDKYELIF